MALRTHAVSGTAVGLSTSLCRRVLAALIIATPLLVTTGCQHGPWEDKVITLPYAAPYETGLRVRPAIRRECDLERRVANEIGSTIRGQFASIQKRAVVNASTPGMALELRILHVEGKSGAARGHKILTVGGTLYEDGSVIGSFTATRRTKRGRHACRMMWENIEEISEDVSRWLETPTRDAYLGDARPGDNVRENSETRDSQPTL